MPVDNMANILAFGAHPDDIEFGCGAVIARETLSNKRTAHFVVCSKGEAGTNGTPEERAAESTEAARLLHATIEFIDFDGDSHLQIRTDYTLQLAETIRRVRPKIVLTPSCIDNQHPDHARLGKMVRDAARLARYGGLKELAEHKTHAIEQLFFYAVTPEGEPVGQATIFIDVSSPDVVDAWKAAMEAHKTQASTRNYLDLQITRARLFGTRAGVEYAMALYPSDPMVFESLSQTGTGARRF